MLSGKEDLAVTVDAAASNDLFYFDHRAIPLNGLVVTAPGGSAVTPENAEHRQIPQHLRRAAEGQGHLPHLARKRQPVRALQGERRADGAGAASRKNLAKEIPASATDVVVTQAQRRLETFVSVGDPDDLDSVGRCSATFPSDATYFGKDGPAVANDRNTLWGDYVVVRPSSARSTRSRWSTSKPMPPWKRRPATPSTARSASAQPGGRDHREPLGSVWGVPTVDRTLLKTDLIVWREIPTADPNAAYTGLVCGAGLDWTPLPQNEVTLLRSAGEFAPSPAAATNVSRWPPSGSRPDPPGIGTPFDQGWCRLDLGLAAEVHGHRRQDFPRQRRPKLRVAAELRHGGQRPSASAAVMLRSACATPRPPGRPEPGRPFAGVPPAFKPP